MVGEYDIDGLAQHGSARILDGHSGRDDRAHAAQIGIEAGLIVENPDPDDIVGYLRASARHANDDKTYGRHSKTQPTMKSHGVLPLDARPLIQALGASRRVGPALSEYK